MGKTEKIVVLSVLFVIVVLFVWSLDQGGAGQTAPVDGGVREVAEGGGGVASLPGRGGEANPGPVVELRAEPGPGAAADRGPLLVSEVGGAPAPPSAITIRPEWDLVSVQGLASTVDPEVFAAVGRPGDEWEKVALRYYGDTTRVRLLRRYNEGTAPGAGVTLLIPAIDRLPAVPEVREVEVLDGEGLWHVAQRVYGSGAKWSALYEANRDRIPNKDLVRPGTLLRIP